MSGPIGSSQWIYNPSTGFYDHTINQSLRFNSGDSSYLAFDPSSSTAGTWTVSFWVKRANLGVYQYIYYSGAVNARGGFAFDASDKFVVSPFNSSGANMNRFSVPLYRDPAAWYHIVITANGITTSNLSTNLVIYVNGVAIETTQTSLGSPTGGDRINDAQAKRISGLTPSGGQHFDGMLAEWHWIDGTVYDQNNFGEFKDGLWTAKEVTGLSYGAAGYYLNFADSSDIGNNANTTDGTNDWTPSGLVASDVVPDSPTNNWCVLNSVKTNESLSINQTFSQGNLDFTSSEASSNPAVTSTFAVSSGKWYWEVYIRNYGNTVNSVGIASTPNDLERDSSALYSKTTAYSYQANGSKHNNSDASYGDTWTTGDIISVALDLDAGAVYFYKNGTIQNSGTAAFTGLSGEFTSYSLVYTTAGGAQVYNFGQDDSFAGNKTSGTAGASDSNGLGTFYYSVPSGYKSLCASNLPDPTIGPGQTQQADNFFDIALYTGNGTALASGGNVITGMELAPEFLWLKRRNSNANGAMYDVVQGVGKGVLPTHNTYSSFTTSETVGSFNSDGFTLGSNSTNNNNTTTNIAWAWKLGGAPTVDNSAGAGAVPTAGSVKIDGSNSTASLAGTIPALRQSANTTAGISITKYVGTGSVGTVAHSLNEAPELVFTKSLDSTKDFLVYSDIAGPQYYLRLNGNTDGIKTLATSSTPWNDTAPTNSVVTLGTATHHNTSGDNNIMWAFHSVEGYCKITEYTGNGNFEGPFCFLGFRARFFIIRSQSSANQRHWPLFNTETYTFNSDAEVFFRANTTDDEFSSNTRDIDILSNGLKMRGTSSNINKDGERYLVWAYAENPFKFANAR